MHGNNSIRGIKATFTRPADTTAYAAGDAISNATGTTHALMLFENVADNVGKGGLIVDSTLVMSTAAATALQCELWLFDTQPTAFEDNAAFDPSDAEALTVVAVLPFTTPYKSANNAVYHSDQKVVPFQCRAPVRASAVLTTGDNPSNTETVTIDGRVYTFLTTLTGTANQVLIGANEAASIANLAAAISRGPGAGTLYSAATPANTSVRVKTFNATTLTVEAHSAGSDQNAIALSEGLTGSWATSTLAGGNSGKELWGQIVARNAYTPASGEVFTLTLNVQP